MERTVLSDIVLLEEAEAKAKAELGQLREFYDAVTAHGMARIKAVHEYECPFWRNGNRHGSCNCGGCERQARIDRALAVLAEAAEDAIDG